MSDDKEVIIFLAVMVVIFMLFGAFVYAQFFGELFQHITETKTVVVATTTVSVIAEKQECDKAGGDFEMYGYDYIDTSSRFNHVSDLPAFEISCIKTQNTTIFDTKFAE